MRNPYPRTKRMFVRSGTAVVPLGTVAKPRTVFANRFRGMDGKSRTARAVPGSGVRHVWLFEACLRRAVATENCAAFERIL
jgi:hypothetical protein